MNEDIMQGKWQELQGGVKEKWGKLTDDDLNKLNGKIEQLHVFCKRNTALSRTRAKNVNV
jgi:uncharacterized protein YjbJ (UPF0337 family)